MRDTDYGTKIGQALDAIRKMHSQVSQLLVDCDDLFPGYKSVFGSYATSELTYNMRAECWMAEGVYRYWYAPDKSVVGITVIFFRPDGTAQREQPLLVVGRIDYKDFDSKNPKATCEQWDLWYSVTNWDPQPFQLGQIRTIVKPKDFDRERVDNAVSIAVPLFSIERLADVKHLFGEVGVEVKPSDGH